MTDSSAALGEVELRRRLEDVASLVTVGDDGWEALQERLAHAGPPRRRPPLKPLAAAAAAVLVLGVIVLVGRDRDERVTTVDTTTTTGEDPSSSTSTTTADRITGTTAPVDGGGAPAGSAPGGPAGLDGGPGGGDGGPGGDGGADPGGAGSPSPGGTPAVTGPSSTTTSSTPPGSTPPPVTAPASGADLEATLGAVRTDVVTFTATVTNRGPDVAPAAWIAIEVEETVLVNFVRSTVGNCTISPDGGLVFICQPGDIDALDSVTVTLEAQVLASPGTPLNATVTTGSSAPDPVGPGSSDSVSIPA